jgi:hypothetical protein
MIVLLDSIKQRYVLLVVLNGFDEIFELAAEHAPHHLAFEGVYVLADELLHHLLDLAIGNEPNKGVLVFHQPDRVV